MRHYQGVREAEHLLIELLSFLETERVSRDEAERALLALIASTPPRAGAIEALEFTMRTLRWESVRAGLERIESSAENFRTRDAARHALRAYDEEWPEGRAYRTYK